MGYAAIDHSQVVFATLGILCAVNPCLFSGYLIGILQGPLYLQFWSSQLRMIRYSRAISFVFWVYTVRWFWFFVSLSVCAPNRQLRFMCALSCRINTKSSITGLAHVLTNRFPWLYLMICALSHVERLAYLLFSVPNWMSNRPCIILHACVQSAYTVAALILILLPPLAVATTTGFTASIKQGAVVS